MLQGSKLYLSQNVIFDEVVVCVLSSLSDLLFYKTVGIEKPTHTHEMPILLTVPVKICKVMFVETVETVETLQKKCLFTECNEFPNKHQLPRTLEPLC